MKKQIICLSVIACMMFSGVASYAATGPYKVPSGLQENEYEKALKLTVAEAVAYGLEHNLTLEIVNNKVRLAELSREGMKEKRDALESAERSYDANIALINSKYAEIAELQEDLDAAYLACENGIAPASLSLRNPIPPNEVINIVAGDHIEAVLSAAGIPEPYLTPTVAAVKEGIEDELDLKQADLDSKTMTLSSSSEMLSMFYDKVLDDVTLELESMIDFHATVDLDVEELGELLVKMGSVNLNVTKYAEEIYRNQIAMLIMKNYYDTLYAEKMVEVKEVAMERGRIQYDMVKLSYNNGMKAKDDYLLAKMYYEGTVIDHRLAEATYANAMYELKESLNCGMDCDLTLEDDLEFTVREASLEDALESGLRNRMEIQQIIGTVTICQLNREIIKDQFSNYEKHYEYEEADTLYQNALDNLAMIQNQVSSEIHQSYELVEATGDMFGTTVYLVEEAEEVLEIAKLKYEQGFGVENALLSGLGLESSSGTMVELIAAEENLAEIQAKVAQVRYKHTVARVKFLNDAGILIY